MRNFLLNSSEALPKSQGGVFAKKNTIRATLHPTLYTLPRAARYAATLLLLLCLGVGNAWGSETVDCSGASATSSTGNTNKSTSTSYTVYFTRGGGGWNFNSGKGYQGKTDAIAVFKLTASTSVDIIISNSGSSNRTFTATAKPFNTVALGDEFISILEVSNSKPAKYEDCVSSSKNYAGVKTTSPFYSSAASTMCTLSNTQLSTSTSYTTGNQTLNASATSVEYSLGTLPAGVYAVGFSAVSNSNVSLAGFKFTASGGGGGCTSHSVNLSSSGSVTGGTFATSSATVCEEETATLTATPAAGYVFTSWSASGTGSSLSSTTTNPTTLTMGTADVSVNATFTKVYASGTYTFYGNTTVGSSPSKTVTTTATDYDAFRIDNLFFSSTNIQYESGSGSTESNDYYGWKVKKSSTIKFFVEDDSDVKICIGTIGGGTCTVSYTDHSSVAHNNTSISSGSHETYEVKGGTMVTLSMAPSSSKSVTLKQIMITPSVSCTAPTAVYVTQTAGTADLIAGESFTLSAATSTGVEDGATYQWYRGDTPVGTNSPTYTVNSCTSTDAGTYWCKITNPCSADAHTTNVTGYGIKVWQVLLYSSSWNAYNLTSTGTKTGETTAQLAPGTYYVKLTHNNGVDFGVGTGESISEISATTPSAWTLYNGQNNVRLTVSTAGTYTFGVNYTSADNPTLSVTYPSATISGCDKIYFCPTQNSIATGSAKFSIYFWNDTENGWANCYLVDGTEYADDAKYVAYAPSSTNGWTKMIVVRDDAYASSFSGIWNQSQDITYNGYNYIVGTGWSDSKMTTSLNSFYSSDTPAMDESEYCVIVGGTTTASTNLPSSAVTYTSANTSVAEVGSSTGVITGVAAGSTTITAKVGSCTVGSATVTVYAAPSVSLSSYSATYGGAAPTLTPSNFATITGYSSTTTGTATINGSGVISIVAAGTTTFTVTGTDACGNVAEATTSTFTVNKADISPELSYASTTLTYGGSNSATPTITGNTGSGSVTYAVTASSPSGCITVNSSTGVVTPVAAGTGTVTATIGATTNYNGNTATADFTVNKATPTKYNFSVDKTVLCGGETATLTLEDSQEGITYQLYSDSSTPIADTEKAGTGDALEWTGLGAGTYRPYANANANYDKKEMGSNKVTVSAGTTTSITTQPEDVTDAEVGVEASLEVEAEGTSLTYQWKESSTSDGTYSNVASGGTSATYAVTPAAAGTKWYKCVVTGTCGTETTDAVKIVAAAALDPLVTWTMNLNNATWGAASTSNNDNSEISSIATSCDAGGEKASKSATAKVLMASAEVTTSVAPDKSAQFTFTLASGNKIIPKKITCQVFNVSAGQRTYKAQISDNNSHVYNSTNTLAVSTEATLTAATFNFAADLELTGNVTLRIYAWDTDDSKNPTDFRMGQYIKFYGTIESTCSDPADPNGLAVGSITSSGATFTITDEESPASYDIYYSTSSTAPTSGTAATTTSTSKTKSVTGLTKNTTYYTWVRAVCDGSHKSEWVALGTTSFKTLNTYTVTYNGNGNDDGSVPTDASSPYDAGATVTVLGNTGNLVKSGYLFAGWNTADNGSGEAYSAGETFDISANTTLCAQWTELASKCETMNSSFFGAYNAAWEGDPKWYSTINNVRYSFDGLDEEKTSLLSFPNGTEDESWINIGANSLGTIREVKITFGNIGVENANSNQSGKGITYGFYDHASTWNFGLVSFYNKDYITGNTSVSFRPTSDDQDIFIFKPYGTPLEITSICIYYIPNGYTVTYANGGATSGSVPAEASHDVGSTVTVLGNTGSLEKNGYTFAGWSDGVTTYTASETFEMPNEDVTLTAVWTPNDYTITYHLNGASWASAAGVASYTVGTGATLPLSSAMTNVGYTFDGWKDNSGLTGSSVTTIGTSEYGNKEYWAKWTEVSYTITYNKNNGSATGSTSNTVGHYVTVADCGFALASNVFTGWNTATNGSGASYAPGEDIELTGNMTLYAQWASDFDVAWTITKIDSKLYRGGGGYTVTAVINDASWDAVAADANKLELSATEGVTLRNITKSINGDSKAQITANFGITTDVDEDATQISFTLSVPENNGYGAKEDVHNESLTDCSGGSAIVWDFSDREAVSFSGQTYSFLATDGTTEMRYTAASSSEGIFAKKYNKDGSVKELGYLKENGSSSDATVYDIDGETAINRTRLIRLFITGTGRLKIDCSSNIGIYKLINGSKTGTVLLAAYKSDTTSAEITVTTSPLWIETTTKGYINKITWTASGGSTVTPTLTWSGGLSDGGEVNKEPGDLDFTYTASTTSNTLGAITYSSSNTSVATVNAATGQVRIIAEGNATITATLAASGCYEEASISYDIDVFGEACEDPFPTITTTDRGCDGIQMSVSESGSYQWYMDDAEIDGETENTYTATSAGEYYVVVSNTGEGHCDRASNTVTIAAKESVTATKIVNSWYVKNGRRTPDIALVQTENATGFYVKIGDDEIWDEANEETTGFGGCGFYLGEDGIIYLKGQKNDGTAPSGLDANETLKITATGCGGNADELSITINWQDETERPSVAFVSLGTEKGAFTDTTANYYKTTPLYKYLDYTLGGGAFDLTAQNIYSTVDEQALREHYSQFDAILITDDPNTGKKKDGKSYVDAMGALIDIRPMLTMEAFVSKLANWKAKGINGNPSSPNPRQYGMKLECKDHEIFADLNSASSNVDIKRIDGIDYWTVLMVDSTKSPYSGVAYNASTSDKPALQGFSASDVSGLLLLGEISAGTLYAGVERQDEPAARLMLLGLNNKALPNALTDEGKKVIANALTYLLKTNMEDVDDCSNYFTGAAGTTDWNTTGNWLKPAVPNSPTTKVRILKPCVVSGGTFQVASVDIATSGKSLNLDGGECSGKLTINPTGALIVGGEVRTAVAPNFNSADLMPTTVNDLVINTNSTAQACLIMNNDAGDTKATVNLYSLGRNDGSYQFQYMAIPMSYVPVNPSFAGAGIYTYVWQESSNGWERRGYYTDLYAFEGVGITTTAATASNYQMKGSLAPTTTKEIALTRDNKGLNLVGNSWTAPIQISKLSEDNTDDNIEKVVYIYSTGYDAEGGALSGGTETAGQWLAIPFNAAGFEAWGGLKVIPSMQAFQVKVKEGGATLTLDYDKVVRGDNQALNAYLRAPKRTTEPSDIVLTRLRVADTKTHTDLYLFEGEQFSDAYDNGWEANFRAGDGRSAMLYARTAAGVMAVAALPELEGTQVFFIPGKETEYTFTFNGGDDTYYLNDIKEQKSTLINEANSYTFRYESGDAANRFIISRTPFEAPSVTTGITDLDAETPKAIKVIYNDKLYIIRGGRVYSADGSLVK